MSKLGTFFFPFQRKSKENKGQTHAETCIRLCAWSFPREDDPQNGILFAIGNWARGERNMALASSHDLDYKAGHEGEYMISALVS